MDYPRIEKPTEPGRYWFRSHLGGEWDIVLVFAKGPHRNLYVAWHGIAPRRPLDEVRGEWRGPIPEPTS